MTSKLEQAGRPAGVYFTASDLMAADFPPPRWAVPGLIPEGLTVLAGAPKFGKSFLCLGLAVSVASGGMALGKIKVDKGEVLYAALEDYPRRLQERMGAILGDDPVPEGLHLVTRLPRLPDLVGYLSDWLETHPRARLVILDVLRKIRPQTDGKGNAYNEDYDTLTALKDLADKHSTAFLVVHHTRKQLDDGDVFNEVSGSTGMTGAADAVLVAKRSRNTTEAILHLTGRDVSEREYGLTWSGDACTWTVLDAPAIVATMSAARRRILSHIADNEGDHPAEVAEALGIDPANARQTMRRMVDDDQLGTDGEGRYFLPASLSHLSPESFPQVNGHDAGVTPQSHPKRRGDSSDRSDSDSRGAA